MSDRATLRRLLQEHKEDAILRLFDTVQNEHDAQVAALTAALAAANEDAARLAIVAADGSCCVLHDRWLNLMMDEDEHTADCPITLHRARVGGAE